MSKLVTELQKNSREVIRFRLGEYKGHNFVDVRIFTIEEGKDPAPSKKGLAISPKLWPQFKTALVEVERALVADGWLDPEDMDIPF